MLENKETMREDDSGREFQSSSGGFILADGVGESLSGTSRLTESHENVKEDRITKQTSFPQALPPPYTDVCMHIHTCMCIHTHACIRAHTEKHTHVLWEADRVVDIDIEWKASFSEEVDNQYGKNSR